MLWKAIVSLEFIYPNWSAPENINSVTTTRKGGFSKNEYQSFNLGEHVNDSIDLVNKNRELLKQELQLPHDPIWLDQVHGINVLQLDQSPKTNNTVDAAYINQKGVVGAVLTADCLPVVFCDKKGKHIAIAHAGWRGLVKGVLENTLQKIPVANQDLNVLVGACNWAK